LNLNRAFPLTETERVKNLTDESDLWLFQSGRRLRSGDGVRHQRARNGRRVVCHVQGQSDGVTGTGTGTVADGNRAVNYTHPHPSNEDDRDKVDEGERGHDEEVFDIGGRDNEGDRQQGGERRNGYERRASGWRGYG
jgi:hypothetical protein